MKIEFTRVSFPQAVIRSSFRWRFRREKAEIGDTQKKRTLPSEWKVLSLWGEDLERVRERENVAISGLGIGTRIRGWWEMVVARESFFTRRFGRFDRCRCVVR